MANSKREVHEIYKDRSKYGEYHTLFLQLKNDSPKFYAYMRMKIDTFHYILERVADSLEKNWCNYHVQKILPEERLVVTIRYLATGNSYNQLSLSFRIGVSTISGIIPEVMNALWKIFQPIHMPIPTKKDFLQISKKFFETSGMPHCLGAIDGRHIRIRKPSKSGSLYYNYKNFFSIVLQAVVDARRKFIFIDVGGYGSQSDGGTFRASLFYRALFEKKLDIPEENALEGSHVILPYFFVADGAYPLMEKVMKPFPGKDLSEDKVLFNSRLSKARVVVENAFGFSTQKWRIYYTAIEKDPEIVKLIVKTTCILQNILIDLEHQKEENLIVTVDDNILISAKCEKEDFVVGCANEVREELTKYFMKNELFNVKK